MRRRSVPALAAAATALVLTAGCGSSGGTSTATTSGSSTGGGAGATGASVTIDHFAFNPKQLTVKAGTTVTWTNKDDAVHTVKWVAASIPASADLIPRSSQATYSHTFTTPGTFRYVCGIHPYMLGEVIVTP